MYFKEDCGGVCNFAYVSVFWQADNRDIPIKIFSAYFQVLKAIQVLRIHLLELEKVNELCKDFCTRYITCLKGKLNSENIMKTLDINSTPPTSPNRLLSTSSYTESESSPRQEQVPNERQIQPKPNDNMTRSFSVSQDSLHSSNEVNTLQISRSMSVDSALNSPALKMNEIPINDVTSGFLSKKGKAGKRGVLPKAATSVLKGWLFQHLVVSRDLPRGVFRTQSNIYVGAFLRK